MPTVTYAKGAASSPTLFLTELQDMATTALLTKVSDSRAVLHLGDLTFTLTGSVFTFARIDGIKTLTGGTLDKIVVADGGTKQLTIAQFSLDLADLHHAATAEHSDTGALEHLLFPLGWHYIGNAAADNLPQDAQSADGVPINLTGDDYFTLKGGFVETLFLGGGNDTAFGGNGFDVLYGGTGRDILHGDSGDDQLIGGNQGDALFGEGGNDRFYGGSGDDLINAGRGFDTVAGEQGHDTFVFHKGDGKDQITDFDLARDTIDLPDTPYIFIAAGTSTILHYGPGVDQGLNLDKDQITLTDINPNDAALIHIA